MPSGLSSSPTCRSGSPAPREAALPPTTAPASRGSSGSSGPAHGGRTCRRTIRARRPAGGGWPSGSARRSGSISGAPSSASSTKLASSTGARPSWTGPSPRRKRGALRGKDTQRQGDKVHGTGRRPGCSSRSAPFSCDPRGALARARHARRASDRAAAGANRGRQGLRRPVPVGGAEGARHRSHRAAPAHPREPLPGPTQAAQVPAPLDRGADQRLALQLPAPGGPLRAQAGALPGVPAVGLRAHRAEKVGVRPRRSRTF